MIFRDLLGDLFSYIDVKIIYLTGWRAQAAGIVSLIKTKIVTLNLFEVSLFDTLNDV